MTTLTDDEFLAELHIPTGGELLDAIRAGARDAFADYLTAQQENPPRTTPTTLGDRLRRLAPWADAVPPVHRTAVAIRIDRLEILLGLVDDEAPADPELELEDDDR